MLPSSNPYYKQVQLLMRVLPQVFYENIFALKGGTAINLFVRDMPRLSIDIDLMYLPVQDREESLHEISVAFENMANRIERSIGNAKANRLTQRNDGELSELQIDSNGARIKIEASPVIRGTVKNPSLRKTSPKVEAEFGFVEVPVVDIDDLYAGKICAALDRQHPRDFFDIRGLLDNEGITSSIMDVFIAYLISSNQPTSKLLKPNLIDLKKIYE